MWKNLTQTPLQVEILQTPQNGLKLRPHFNLQHTESPFRAFTNTTKTSAEKLLETEYFDHTNYCRLLSLHMHFFLVQSHSNGRDALEFFTEPQIF